MHDARCPQCSQVLGADNQCEHCHALVPALRRGGRIVCSACGSERRRGPNTITVSERELRFMAGWERVRIRIYKVATALAVLFGLFIGALFWLFAPNAFELGSALVTAFVTLLIAGLFVQRIKKVRALSQQREHFLLEQRVLGLAHKNRGVITAAEVARHLNIPVTAADAMLDELVRTGRADIDVTDRGDIRFLLHADRAVLPSARSAYPNAAQVAAQVAARKQRQ